MEECYKTRDIMEKRAFIYTYVKHLLGDFRAIGCSEYIDGDSLYVKAVVAFKDLGVKNDIIGKTSIFDFKCNYRNSTDMVNILKKRIVSPDDYVNGVNDIIRKAY